MEVLSKDIGILTPFGQTQPFLGTFVLSKETSSLMGLWWSIQSFLGTVIVFAGTIVWKDDRIWVKNYNHKYNRC